MNFTIIASGGLIFFTWNFGMLVGPPNIHWPLTAEGINCDHLIRDANVTNSI